MQKEVSVHSVLVNTAGTSSIRRTVQRLALLNITLGRSRLSGVARATIPDEQSHLIFTLLEQDLIHRLLSWRYLWQNQYSLC